MAYSTGSHTRFYHRYHVVWATKYRHQVLQGPMRERIREIIRQACAEMGVHIVKGVLARDHVHIGAAADCAVEGDATYQGAIVSSGSDGVSRPT